MHTTITCDTITNHQLEALAEHGYTIIDNYLPPPMIAALQQQAIRLRDAGIMHQASIGKDETNRIISEVRGDSIYWLDDAGQTPEQTDYLHTMQALQEQLNHCFFLGLFEFECHFAVYDPGAVYLKHLDQFKGQQERQITAVLYLNDDWQQDDGGALRLYLNESENAVFVDIAPLGGRLALFLSGRFYHEVLPAQRTRISLTGWFRTRSLESR
ncbi:MAG: 2OG-Fe(II) oxygenase [Betaproteobacteria bacterium HGW-Betaproteobacteria-1]|jgi:SM-20-related protein|nr:MAG: 2OG-Fe(II) oxygenase [Betaproteobacteria bacterium HGW-Betaproteobacteria-1]